MLAVLDPLLFAGISEAGLNEVARILRQTQARIPDSRYWKKLQLEVIRPLSRECSRQLRIGLDVIRRHASKIHLVDLPPRPTVWDFRLMFAQAGSEWVDIMGKTLAGCTLTGEETILITRLISGRNAEEHSGPGDCRLTEKTCWNLRVQVPEADVHRIPAICSRRNIFVPWTTRLDDKLPAESDGASFPYCPPPDWHKSSVDVFETHQSRPAWLDAKGGHWACPATGWGYHWDVYLELALADHYGLNQLNIVRWGAPAGEGAIGAVHHLPRDKKARLKRTLGWSC